jgi:hypothetical protein
VRKKICAVCNQRDGKNDPIFAFPELMKELGFVGKIAHPRCVVEAKRARIAILTKRGLLKADEFHAR